VSSLGNCSLLQEIVPDGNQDYIPWGYAAVSFVLKSDEWARPGGCKPDTPSIMVNGVNILDPHGSVTVCRALTEENSLFNWQTYRKGDTISSEDGPRVYFFQYLMEPEEGCPLISLHFKLGQRLDFVIRLKGSGDGKAPTVMYIGKSSIEVKGNDC
jgi:hypothetical protein